MRYVKGSLLVVLVLACVGWAQDAPAEAPADKEDVQRLFTALHLHEMMQNLMATTMQQQKEMAHDALKKKTPSMSEDELKRMDTFMDEFVKKIDMDGMLEDMVPVYQRHLTKQDVSAMLTFYNSPTGQKLLREQPAMDKVEEMAREDSQKSPPATSK
jgi:hypothetical protein